MSVHNVVCFAVCTEGAQNFLKLKTCWDFINFHQQLSIPCSVFTFCVFITGSFIAIVFLSCCELLNRCYIVHPRVLKLSDLCLKLESFGESKA